MAFGLTSQYIGHNISPVSAESHTKEDSSHRVMRRCQYHVSVADLAEIPLKSPQNLYIFIIKKYICWVKVSKNNLISFWKKNHYTT